MCEAALRQTAAYLNERHQFGRPLSTFQGTMLRAADAAIDIEAMRVTWQNAAWRFDTGRDAADAGAGGQVAGLRARPAHGARHPAPARRAWGPTSPTRSTATSCGASRSSCCWAARARSWPISARPSPQQALAAAAAAMTAAPRARVDAARPSSTSPWATSCPTLVLPITRTLIVSGALASRDYQDVHHDPVLAQRAGLQGHLHEHPHHQRPGRPLRHRLVGAAQPLAEVDIRLGAPNYPDCTMTLTGSVTDEGPARRRRHDRRRSPSPSGAPTTWATT